MRLSSFAFYIQNLIRINYEKDSFRSAPGPEILSEKIRPLSVCKIPTHISISNFGDRFSLETYSILQKACFKKGHFSILRMHVSISRAWRGECFDYNCKYCWKASWV